MNFTPDRTRTCNPQIRSLVPYPLGHRSYWITNNEKYDNTHSISISIAKFPLAPMGVLASGSAPKNFR